MQRSKQVVLVVLVVVLLLLVLLVLVWPLLVLLLLVLLAVGPLRLLLPNLRRRCQVDGRDGAEPFL